jgi:hypothetical protein
VDFRQFGECALNCRQHILWTVAIGESLIGKIGVSLTMIGIMTQLFDFFEENQNTASNQHAGSLFVCLMADFLSCYLLNFSMIL